MPEDADIESIIEKKGVCPICDNIVIYRKVKEGKRFGIFYCINGDYNGFYKPKTKVSPKEEKKRGEEGKEEVNENDKIGRRKNSERAMGGGKKYPRYPLW